ncbi:MAG: chemotaxis protein CheW [Gammaproteobacteria bacterium]|nr:chemotaxis protein CheW [Gammaproteobacteria bacterium]
MNASDHNNEMKNTDNDQQFLTFRLADQDYGIEILKVQEIKGWSQVTPLPNSPKYIKGVLNLRGTIVPVIDLRLRFNLEEAEYDSFTVIMVVNVGGRLAGLVVDSVSDVISMSDDQYCDTPEFEGQINRQFIGGLGQIGDKLFILLKAEKIVDEETLDAVSREELEPEAIS